MASDLCSPSQSAGGIYSSLAMTGRQGGGREGWARFVKKENTGQEYVFFILDSTQRTCIKPGP